ncbi:putative DUF21 domain-containing protein At3g13070, chloroplastic isoform X1 [Camellia sinensis]|uniref:putative DUF21 domain-containing protein At3g13070, chloroplastic isoform X1 n=1 Tax=Camellia sinensis TaxID=4442 RepID=UPI00103589C9|nr:putative DUF21 domain-containing protein At3g13070, chloroplastic isoform X1 [Camellia sinensis]
MDVVAETSLLNPPTFFTGSKRSLLVLYHRQCQIRTISTKNFLRNLRYSSRIPTNCVVPYRSSDLFSSRFRKNEAFDIVAKDSEVVRGVEDSVTGVNLGFLEVSVVRRGTLLAATVFTVLLFWCRRVFAMEGVVNLGYGVIGQRILLLKSYWPKVLQVLMIFKEQGLVLAALLGLSAFFSMAETSITTLWPWKVRELAEKEPEDGVFKMLRSDVTRFLTTILIGTTVVNIGATALVTEAATAAFGEAGVSAATGVMTVAVLLLTEITPKSIAVHNATEVARFVVRPVAWLSLILYPVGRVVTYLSMGMLKMLGLKGRSEPYVTEDELKLMLRGAELSGAIEEEEQDMIENVLEIKDTHVREVMTPLVDVVAIDASATLVDFHNLWVTHQYSRVPVFEQRVDNIVGIAYAMDLLDYVQKGELLESSAVGDMAQKPAYFVPDSMSVWNLLREFRIRKVHMAVVLNEYGGTVGIVTLEDVVEEIVGEIFDENDSKEEIQKKTGYIVMRAEGIYDVDANTSIDQLSEDLNIKMPEGHQYETVSGFICEAFGYIPRTGETIKVVVEKGNQEEHDEYTEAESDRQDEKGKHQIFKLEILAGNARKVSAARFERVNHDEAKSKAKEVTRTFPKIMKRKWSSNEDSDKTDYDEDSYQKRAENDLSDGYIINEHELEHEHEGDREHLGKQ